MKFNSGGGVALPIEAVVVARSEELTDGVVTARAAVASNAGVDVHDFWQKRWRRRARLAECDRVISNAISRRFSLRM